MRLSDYAVAEHSQTQGDLSKTTARLASGLRVLTAADDPSGLAIATSLQSQALGLDQGVQNVQEARNALTVADGAMQSITDIIQRMRALVVEARSDLMSAADIADVQTELNQLAQQVNSIAGKTQFNGLHLLDGSLTSALPLPYRTVPANNDTLTSGLPLVDPTSILVTSSPPYEQVAVKFSVDSFDPTTDALTITFNYESTDPNFGPTQPPQSYQVAEGTNVPIIAPFLTAWQADDQTGNPLVSFAINNLDRNDVGKSATIVTVQQQAYQPGGSAPTVALGDREGDTVAISIGSLSTNDLGIGDNTLGDDLINTGVEYRLDGALQSITSMRATLGAQMVSLDETATDANSQSVSLEASQSSIRDLNVAQATTQFAKDNVEAQLQTQVINDTRQMSLGLTKLLMAGLQA